MAYPKEKTETYDLMGGRNSKASPYNNTHHEMRELVNLNFVKIGALTSRPGSAFYSGATTSGRITGGVEYERLNGASYIVVTANTNAYTVSANSFLAIKTGLKNDALFSFVTFVDRLFACNGNDYFKFDGTNTAPFSLPKPPLGWGITAVAGGSLTSGVTTVFQVSVGYQNDRGYFGPGASAISITIDGTTNNSIAYCGLTIIPNFGISGIQLYRSTVGGFQPYGTTLIQGSAILPATTYADGGMALGTRPTPEYLYFTLVPRYLEIFNNQLFMAGFSSILSAVYWSDIGEPEGVLPEYSNEFRTNDGDRITGMKSYNGSLVVTKERSVHRVFGDDPANFAFKEISDQYGCLSHRTMVVWENHLWFLDSKGIVEYEGTGVKIVSNKLEDIFTTMNISAARDVATAIHYRRFNEVWFAIPTGTSIVNDTIIVYDYVAGSWTTYSGITASVLFLGKGSLSEKSPFFGGYSGSVSYVSPSLMNDYGRAITCMFKTAFLAPTGETTERMYRRFYGNVDPVAGVTLPITINFRTNYGTSIQATRTMYQSPYQTRVDFGIAGRAIQAEMIRASASYPITWSGHAFDSRFQRDN